MSYNFVPDSFHTKKLCTCSRLSSSEVRFHTENGRFAFLSPLGGGLGATYVDHLRLIGMRVVDFLLMLIELFSLRVTAETLRAIVCSKSTIFIQRGPVDPQFQIEWVAPHQPYVVSLSIFVMFHDRPHVTQRHPSNAWAPNTPNS